MKIIKYAEGVYAFEPDEGPGGASSVTPQDLLKSGWKGTFVNSIASYLKRALPENAVVGGNDTPSGVNPLGNHDPS
jgi:hypothetical protein